LSVILVNPVKMPVIGRVFRGIAGHTTSTRGRGGRVTGYWCHHDVEKIRSGLKL